MEKSLFDLLDKRAVIFDGAMGTELLARGIVLGDSAERFSPDFADIVIDIYKAYFDAGADVIHTNTYNATKISLGKKMEGKITAINERQAILAKNVCPKNGFIAGNLGPNGVLLECDGGECTPDMLFEAYSEQVAGLLKGQVDLFSIETMYYLDEAYAAIKAIKEACDLPIIASMTFNKVAEGFRTPVEEKTVAECIQFLEKSGVEAVGCGCTLGSFEMITLAKEMRKATKKPILIQPTAGAPLEVAGKNLYPINPERFAEDMLEIKDIGIEMLGGCCGTTAEHIKEMAKKAKK
jgi:5-methyltetrahydrofolate--homocysteine methyltransferase